MAKARGLALLGALVLAGCGGSSAPKPSNVTLHLALPIVPRQLDPAKASDLPSLNVAHELYSGLTRYSGAGVRPDLAQSWDVGQGGLVWTFHLRKGLRWSDDSPIVAGDFRRAWLHALDPKTGAPYAGPYLGIVRGARRFHATGTGDIGVQALDDRTLRVTLQHPVPWFDELVAHPVTAPEPPRRSAFSGPFRLVSRSGGRLVLERNFNYWDAKAVKPSRLVLSSSQTGADAVLPRRLIGPGLPWIDTAGSTPPHARPLPTMSVGLVWLVTRATQLSSLDARRCLAYQLSHEDVLTTELVPLAVPGARAMARSWYPELHSTACPRRVSLAYTTQDESAKRIVPQLQRALAASGITLVPRPVPTLDDLLALAGPPAQPGVELVLAGWSPKLFDAYNILDLFPCGSAFNVARFCDPAYDRGMHAAVRTLDAARRHRLEAALVRRLEAAAVVVPFRVPPEHVRVAAGVRGFSWSPIGFYELMGMTRS
jgi:ABC-type oligopeptide transport system substrate-binding subunit